MFYVEQGGIMSELRAYNKKIIDLDFQENERGCIVVYENGKKAEVPFGAISWISDNTIIW